MKDWNRSRWIALGFIALLALLAAFDLGWITLFSKLGLAAVCAVLLTWAFWRAYRRFFWKVGRRLAFSYFVVGVLPIPMALMILAVLGYLLSGFFLGHLYRDAVHSLQRELEAQAASRAAAYAGHGGGPDSDGAVVFAYYKGGKRVGGDARAPAEWPGWIEAPADQPLGSVARFVTGSDGHPTLAAAASRQGVGTLALFTGRLQAEITGRTGLWVEVFRSDDPDLDQISLQFSGRKIPIQHVRHEAQAADAAKFFKRQNKGSRFWDSPLLWWGELSGPLYDLRSGKVAAEYLAANLNGTSRTVLNNFFSTSGEIDTFAWVALLVVSFLLFDVYFVAALMAIVMIYGLSGAVNRLSKATESVRHGDFSVRIPVRRRDQLGDLQRSFNEMSGHLESLVATATQKELLEKELALARDLQQSLIPTDLPSGEGVEFSTFFEPTAAIGGDYFDVLRLNRNELAVIIADVSGHGLSTGLRMAMLKAAFLILIEETRAPAELLRRLDAVVRAQDEKKFFVTATLGILDLATATLSLTNAGHPPTYIVRRGVVEEVVLSGAPLGRLGHDYGQREIPLERGDVVVWLSDGLIEAVNPRDEPLGYEGVRRVLAGPEGADATAVRNRLLAAVEAHTEGRPNRDDSTLVVMRYLGPPVDAADGRGEPGPAGAGAATI